MEAHAPALHLDPISESIRHLVCIVFLKSRSPLYSYAVSIAQNAERYAEADIGGKPVHYTVFPRTQTGVARALALLDLVKNWQGVQCYAGGALQTDPWGVLNVLNCYLKALKCDDTTAHCHVRIENPFRGPSEPVGAFTMQEALDIAGRMNGEYENYMFPCRHIGFMLLSGTRPESIESQIQAEGVRRGCDICPLFRPADFRKIK